MPPPLQLATGMLNPTAARGRQAPRPTCGRPAPRPPTPIGKLLVSTVLSTRSKRCSMGTRTSRAPPPPPLPARPRRVTYAFLRSSWPGCWCLTSIPAGTPCGWVQRALSSHAILEAAPASYCRPANLLLPVLAPLLPLRRAQPLLRPTAREAHRARIDQRIRGQRLASAAAADAAESATAGPNRRLPRERLTPRRTRARGSA